MSYTYQYPRPAVTVDAVVFQKNDPALEVLLIQRANQPFKDMWALPGGFLDMEETLEQAIHRELEEETNLKGLKLEQLHTFSALHRDPRGRTISTVFFGVLQDDQQAAAGDDASNVDWFHVADLPDLAFDHNEVIDKALERLDASYPELSFK
jgi:8-oxo-dGTP diphosphatase